MIATLVDWGVLGKAVLYSVIFGLGVLVLAGIAVASSLRAQDERGEGHEAASVAFGAITVLGVVGVVAAVAGGIWVMAQ